MTDNNLTEKQKTFCREYMLDLNSTQAAIRAGYSKKTAKVIGHENLTKPDIQNYIYELQAAKRQELNISINDVIRDIVFLKDQCMGREYIVTTDNTGKEIKTKIFNSQGANAALDKLCRHLGVYSADNERSLKVSNLTKDEINNELAKYGLHWKPVENIA